MPHGLSPELGVGAIDFISYWVYTVFSGRLEAKYKKMAWQYKIGKKDGLYSLFEWYDGGGYTEEPILDGWYDSPEEVQQQLEMMLADIEDLTYFNYDDGSEVDVEDEDEDDDEEEDSLDDLEEF